jgi:hypothetical protein
MFLESARFRNGGINDGAALPGHPTPMSPEWTEESLRYYENRRRRHRYFGNGRGVSPTPRS